MRVVALTTAGLLLAGVVAAAADIESGLAVGDKTPAYNPQHVTGPDKGTKTCPV